MKKQIITFLTIVTISPVVLVLTGCSEKTTSPADSSGAIVYINKSENYPTGIDTLYVSEGKQTLLEAGTVKPGNPPQYQWSSADTAIFKVIPEQNDNSKAYATAVGDSGASTNITARDLANNAEKTIFARVLTWPDPNKYTLIGKLSGHYYFVSKYVAQWGAAKTACEESGGHLVTITSQQENDIVKKASEQLKAYIWIGLTSTLPADKSEMAWNATNWITGEPIDYKNWMDGHPRTIKAYELYEFVAVNVIGKWENLGHTVYHYMLEIE